MLAGDVAPKILEGSITTRAAACGDPLLLPGQVAPGGPERVLGCHPGAGLPVPAFSGLLDLALRGFQLLLKLLPSALPADQATVRAMETLAISTPGRMVACLQPEEHSAGTTDHYLNRSGRRD
jgi:hypothetical protein